MKIKFFLLFLVMAFHAAVEAQTVTELQKTGDSLYVRSEHLWQQGDTIGANREMEKSIATFHKINSGDNFSFVSAEYIHAVRLNNQGRSLEALRLLEDADYRNKRLMPVVTELSCLIGYSLTQTYGDLKRYDNAIRSGEKMKREYGMFYGMASKTYLEALYLLSNIYHSAMDYPRCKEVTTEFLSRSIREGFFDETSFGDVYCFARLAESESALGNYLEAEHGFQIADSLLAKIDGVEKIRALVLNRRATNLIKLGKEDLADSCLTAALELDEESISNLVITANNRYAMITSKYPKEAYELYSYLANCLENNGQVSSDLYAMVKSNLAFSCLLLGNTDEGITHIEHALNIMSEKVANTEINGFVTKETRVLLYAQKGDLKKVEQYCGELSKEIRIQLRDVFPLLTERQRTDFWEQFSEWYSFELPFLAMEYRTETLKEECFDAILQSKGILLNSSLNIDRILRNTEDEVLKDMYNQWKTAKKRKMDTNVIEGLERKIMAVLPSHGDFLSDMSINTDSIRKYLKDGEMATEFVSVLDPVVADTVYLALSLKKEYEAPHLTVLCRSGEISEALRESFCNSELYDILWQKLEDEMKGVKQLYFAVDGMLHNIPIEYCPDRDGYSIFEKYECFRLSSTREIVKRRTGINYSHSFSGRDSKPNMKVVLYGDIDYNSFKRADTIVADTTTVLQNWNRSISGNSRMAAQVFHALAGTKRELIAIDQLLGNKGIETDIKTRENATEGTVYNLTKSKPFWLHFATHGYYETAEQVAAYGIKADVEDVADKGEALVLSRSALALSGANNWVNYAEKSSDGSDGLLTAYEIASLDFSNIDMVVLSACESGLGDISNEGVFGLQRGMKKAGVKSLVVSLCKVHDDATTLFMTIFYKKLLEGNNKQRALLEAQRAVRKAENGKWSSPEFWAPFILLDGF